MMIDYSERQMLGLRVQQALLAVGMTHLPLDTPPRQLSDGYKRRLALAVQLIRRPSILLLDEPLAGLDWKARRELAVLLGQLKSECSILCVSHDLRELAPLVDRGYEMKPGGTMELSESWRSVSV